MDTKFYGPKSDYIVTGSRDGSLIIYDKKSESIVQRTLADSSSKVNLNT